jgi:putative FmdB family regulatory protein
MPIYEYQCTACGEVTEALQKISDAPLTDCPACGKAALRKKVSAVAFRLKGGGWYETDFKAGNRKNIAGDGEGKSGGDGASGGGDAAAKGGASDSAASTDSGSTKKKDTGSGAAKATNDS